MCSLQRFGESERCCEGHHVSSVIFCGADLVSKGVSGARALLSSLPLPPTLPPVVAVMETKATHCVPFHSSRGRPQDPHATDENT